MPKFDTPDPIRLRLDLVAANTYVRATDRTDTLVEIRPSNENKKGDVKAAEGTRVDLTEGELVIRMPKNWRMYTPFEEGGTIEILVELPTGSEVRGSTAMGDLRGTGEFGACQFKSSAGNIQLDRTGAAELTTSAGHITVDRVQGPAEITSGSGKLRVGEIDGRARVKNSNGDSWIGQITGPLRITSANGDITVDHAGEDLDARTSNGDLRLGEVVRGQVTAATGYGAVEVGIRRGTAARLDVSSSAGRVLNELTTTEGPATTDEQVEVKARTSYGDVTIRRAATTSGEDQK